MKVLLKQPGNGMFLRDSNRWTGRCAEAMDFKTTPAAMDYSRMHGFHGTIIVLKFDDASYDLELRNCC